MRLLVTGGAGFIGSNFIRQHLASNPNDTILNYDKLTYAGNLANLDDVEKNDRYDFREGDICDYALLRECLEGIDAVVHFAAESHVDNSIERPDEFIRTNIEGTHTILKAARDANIKRFVHISTDEVYGSIREGAFTEASPLDPSSPYSASKASSDMLVKSFVKTYKFPALITRSSNNFGQYQHPEKVIPRFVTNLLEGRKVPLYGDGSNKRDWIYVLDNCEAIGQVLQKGKEGEIYNIGGGNEISNLDLTRKILISLGKDESWIERVPDRKGHDFRYAITTDKIRSIGWQPRHDFAVALGKTIAWYQENRNWWSALQTEKK